MHIRKDIQSLTPEELLALRRAMLELQRRDGERSYIDLAGYHGIPLRHCPHGSPLFLPWHRAYIRIFEQALQTIDPTVSLPFWDWTSNETSSQGMANAHTDAVFTDGENTIQNPLASGPIEDRSRQTQRDANPDPSRLRSFALSVELAMQKNNYLEFNNEIEGPHGSIHVWVGGLNGDMSTVPRAAYDPIFWSHHATVDRQWAIWQKCHPSQNPTPEIMSQTLDGFPSWTVADTINLNSPQLDYTYEKLDEFSCSLQQPSEEAFSLHNNDLLKTRTIVEIHDIERNDDSFMVDIFIRKNSDTQGITSTFGGAFGIFGAQGIHGSNHGHMHHNIKTNQKVDITDAVQKLGLDINTIEVQLKAINKLGETITSDSLPIGEVSVKTIH